MKSAVFLGFLAVCLLVILNFQIAKKIGSIYEKMMQYKDARISLTQDVLMGIRQIKYLNWEPIFEKKILEIRQNEFKCLKIGKYLDALCVFFWATTTVVISTFSFVVYEFLGEDVRKINVFTAIALFNILIFPLNALPWTIAGILTGKVSFKRLMDFFSTPEVQKININANLEENALIIKNLRFDWPKLPNNNDKKKLKEISEDELLKEAFSLRNVNLEVKRGSLTMIVGKIGSGKSALANAILKEMDNVLLNDLDNEKSIDNQFIVNGKISYVSQNSWLQNTTIRVNLLILKF